MRNSKSLVVLFVGLILVFPPLTGVGVQASPIRSQSVEMGESESLSLVFGPIEEHGRVQVTDERLDEEEGEFGTILVATAIAPNEMTDACRGALYSITSYETITRNSEGRPTIAGKIGAGVAGFAAGLSPGPSDPVGLATGVLGGLTIIIDTLR
ncbi:hypothetical protein KGY64_07955 [Candidatus Bipolaricaulota bacterium]|nr:hypothetical protein [Candidatus Bipolaricaulota bacterium]